jgi:hypothetical protein
MGWFIGCRLHAANPCRGVAKLVKALDFDSSMRRFESFFPCQKLVFVCVNARQMPGNQLGL